MSEPQADRYMQAAGLAARPRAAARFRACHAGAARAFLERGPGRLGLFRRRSLGDDGLDDAALARRRARACRARPLALAADRRAALRDRPDARPRLLLDGPADAAPIVPAIALIAAGAALPRFIAKRAECAADQTSDGQATLGRLTDGRLLEREMGGELRALAAARRPASAPSRS